MRATAGGSMPRIPPRQRRSVIRRQSRPYSRPTRSLLQERERASPSVTSPRTERVTVGSRARRTSPTQMRERFHAVGTGERSSPPEPRRSGSYDDVLRLQPLAQLPSSSAVALLRVGKLQPSPPPCLAARSAPASPRGTRCSSSASRRSRCSASACSSEQRCSTSAWKRRRAATCAETSAGMEAGAGGRRRGGAALEELEEERRGAGAGGGGGGGGPRRRAAYCLGVRSPPTAPRRVLRRRRGNASGPTASW
mmetsp:Transcript_10013/g.31620  ORF Transcript_10013/g.31620 Transcript_10013/m.31620 type:complete len:252 (-) Transcript_10013:572-1327(-)